jgi:hypothetical protein
MRLLLALILTIFIVTPGCSDDSLPTPDTQPVVEAGVDASNDGPFSDLSSDGSSDVAVDAGSDVVVGDSTEE